MRKTLHLWSLAPLSRSFHLSSASRHLVGPNDPISNLRPVIYRDLANPAPASHSQRQLNPHVSHPYSLNEFADVPHDHALELQYRLAREQLDAFNHNFWTDSNSRFEAARQSVVASLPESASVETRESALSEFYKKWVMQERTRQEEYATEWQKRNWGNILLAARVEYQRFRRHILRRFSGQDGVPNSVG